ncbi:MAG TPA: lysylphosphatidylglycerol synthase transmembrane domain-containing protein [bacterium]|nr:lysylphosphatidylglycerol synthase transmembrane domain-containing protein [bacterium]
MITLPSRAQLAPVLHNKALLFCIKILIAALLLLSLRGKIGGGQITAAFQNARIGFIIFSFLLLGVNIFLQFKKWQLLVRLAKPEVGNNEILSSLLAGMTLGLVTPGRIGEFGRAMFIKNFKWSEALGLVMIDKIFAVVVIYFFGIIGYLYFIRITFHQFLTLPLRIILFLLLALLLYIILHPQLVRVNLGRIFPAVQKHPKLQLLLSSLDNFKTRQAWILLGYALLHAVTYNFQFYLLICAFADINLYHGLLAVVSIMMVKTLLPVSFGDLGVRESAAIYFLSHFAISGAAAFNASILLFFINVLLPGLAGMVVILMNRSTANQSGVST